ncbi:hypothetical protein KKH39_00695 [Patescibacteria group bacterium]|nr:hypothetical protein [Patescibacteria group bacterium]
MEYLKFPDKALNHILSIPFIYALLFPLILLDIFIELYHRVCFPLYDIPLVPREAYIKIDRQKLDYLEPIQKINCMYCGYANGLLRYATVIAAETEAYWCGIQHQKNSIFIVPKHQEKFVPYDDTKKFDNKYKK